MRAAIIILVLRIMATEIIGRKDKVDLPELELSDIDMKVDTGAYGNALHCHTIELVDGKIRFVPLDPSCDEYHGKTYEFTDFESKEVKSSSGESEKRFVIRTRLVIFGKKYRTKFSLTSRIDMRHPILLGRKFIGGKFLVDVKQKDLSFEEKQKRP